MILSQFQAVGRDLAARGLIASHSGNLSIRMGDRLHITHRGSMLGSLQEHDLVETGVNHNDRATPFASSELAVHRAIYTATNASAIVHAHPPYGVAFSATEKDILPWDMEGKILLRHVPVLGFDCPESVKPGGMVSEIAAALRENKIVLVRGHGTFAVGQLLEEAYHYITTFEESCRILFLLRMMGVKPTDACKL
jgi:L-fuculose-phosphate aldolase